MLRVFFSLLLVASALTLGAQGKTFPTPTLQTVDLQDAELGAVIGQGQPTIIAVWATWCQPCHLELDHMKAYAPRWETEYGARVVAISVDKAFQVRKINPLVQRKGWAYDILVDTGGQLQSRLGFRSIPQMYILDGEGRIVKEFSGYRQGREQEVEAVIRRLSAK